MDGGGKQLRLGCCISHEFYASASSNPDRIAVVHASGGARLFKESRGDGPAGPDLDGRDLSSEPPARSVYDGDTCFTYSELLLAVQTLSSRLRAVLHCGDDPHLIKPSSDEVNNCCQRAQPGFSVSMVPSDPHLAESKDVYRPKVVGICVPPSVEYIVSILSVLSCGEAFLPIDPWWPRDRILSVVSSSNVDVVLMSRISFGKSHDNLCNWITTSVACPLLYFTMDECLQVDRCPRDIILPCECGKERLFCYLMYTSGSTGKPRGVCGTEQGLLNRFLWMQEVYPFQEKECVLFKTSISFIDHLQEVLGAILTASTLVVPPFNLLKENIFSILHFLEAYHISRLTAVPSLMRALLPAFRSQKHLHITKSLKLLVLSGEDFSILLWKMLSSIFSNTSILNLYGSTEVSGDCTFFDCERLPTLLEMEVLTSVPIGQPISNCEVMVIGENNVSDEGEIHVGGLCICSGCFVDSVIVHSDFVELLDSKKKQGKQLFYKTGDFARRLKNGDLVFLGRKDRLLKINGQRVSLVEIESALRRHQDVLDAVVLAMKGPDELILMKAFLQLRGEENSKNVLIRHIRHWLIEKFPAVMIPHHFVILESFPLTSSGKVDYECLSALEITQNNQDSDQTGGIGLLQAIKKAFLDALMVEEVSDEDDFFAIGGDSIAAAHVSFNLRINMRLLYDFPSPYKLYNAILQRLGSHFDNLKDDGTLKINFESGKRKFSVNYEASEVPSLEEVERSVKTSDKNVNDDSRKRLKAGGKRSSTPDSTSQQDSYPWVSLAKVGPCSFSRCNKVTYEGNRSLIDECRASWSIEIPRNTESYLHKLWKVKMGSCVDASPLFVVWNQEIFVLTGAHSEKFACVDAKSSYKQNIHIMFEDRREAAQSLEKMMETFF